MADADQEAVEQWLASRVDQSLANQRGRADNIKLVATFAAGIAATLVATSLQVGAPSWLDLLAALLLGLTLFATWDVLVDSDGLRDIDQVKLNTILANTGWDWRRKLEELRQLADALQGTNEAILAGIIKSLRHQVLAAAATILTATVALFIPNMLTLVP